MKEIFLSNGKKALVDDDDYQRFYGMGWRVKFVGKNLKKYYVVSRAGFTMAECVLGKRPEPCMEIDHINGDSLDNRRSNLRFCTHQQNMWNRRKSSKKTSSVYKGVVLLKGENRWMSQIIHNRKNIYIGRFINEPDAARAYDKKATELFGDFARLNFPEEEIF